MARSGPLPSAPLRLCYFFVVFVMISAPCLGARGPEEAHNHEPTLEPETLACRDRFRAGIDPAVIQARAKIDPQAKLKYHMDALRQAVALKKPASQIQTLAEFAWANSPKSYENTRDISDRLAEALRLYPRFSRMLIMQGHFLTRLERYQEANKLITNYLGKHPNDISMAVLQVKNLIGMRDFNGAEEAINRIESLTNRLGANPRYAMRSATNPLIMRIKFLLAAQRADEALPLIQRLANGPPEIVRLARKMAISTFIMLDELESARSLVDSIESSEDRDLFLAAILIREGDYQEADRLLSTDRIWNSRREVQWLRVQPAILSGNYELAHSLLMKMIYGRHLGDERDSSLPFDRSNPLQVIELDQNHWAVMAFIKLNNEKDATWVRFYQELQATAGNERVEQLKSAASRYSWDNIFWFGRKDKWKPF